MTALPLGLGCQAMAYWPPLQDVWSSRESTNSSTEWRIAFGVYDPVLQSTQAVDTGWFAAASTSLSTNRGVVLWSSRPTVPGQHTLYFNTYDPGTGAWQMTNIVSILPIVPMGTADGVISWHEQDGSTWYFGAAIYDPAPQRWIIHRTGPITAGNVIRGNHYGTVGFMEMNGTTFYVNCWIYDPLRQEWRTRRFGPYTSTFGTMQFVSGSIRIHAGTLQELKGYDYLTGNWEDTFTRPLATFHASATNGAAPLTVWFTDMSLGADVWTWSFGDGSPSTNQRSTNHIFSTSGSNLVSLAITSAFGDGASTNLTIIVTTSSQLSVLSVAESICHLQLTAAAGTIHQLERSTNLFNWTPIRLITNETGTVAVDDPVPPGANVHFYRTLQMTP